MKAALGTELRTWVHGDRRLRKLFVITMLMVLAVAMSLTGGHLIHVLALGCYIVGAAIYVSYLS